MQSGSSGLFFWIICPFSSTYRYQILHLTDRRFLNIAEPGGFVKHLKGICPQRMCAFFNRTVLLFGCATKV
jgi:hypothetical protein